MNNIQFSVLNYYPSFIGTEHIQVGVIFLNLETFETRLELTSNWSRVRSYDDELDIEMFKMMLFNLKNSYEKLASKNDGSLINFIRFYVNELKFSKIMEVYDDDFDEFIARTKRIYLRLDEDKSKRLSKNEQLEYMKQLIKGSDVNYSKLPLKGKFNDDLNFDYVIDGEYAIKIFNFKNKELNRSIRDVKKWAYDAIKIKGVYKTVFIYDDADVDVKNKKYSDIIIEILNDASDYTFNMVEGLNFITTNIQQLNKQTGII